MLYLRPSQVFNLKLRGVANRLSQNSIPLLSFSATAHFLRTTHTNSNSKQDKRQKLDMTTLVTQPLPTQHNTRHSDERLGRRHITIDRAFFVDVAHKHPLYLLISTPPTSLLRDTLTECHDFQSKFNALQLQQDLV